ncbi:hypothetical protein C8J57DRAFT_1360412, partial [Mycena rebaudengoi]
KARTLATSLTVHAPPTTPTLEAQQFFFQQQQGSMRSNLQGSVRGQAPDTQMQMHLPGEPDCTLELVEVPSVRGIKDLPPPPQTHHNFPLRSASFGAGSALSAQSQPPPHQQQTSAASAPARSSSARAIRTCSCTAQSATSGRSTRSAARPPWGSTLALLCALRHPPPQATRTRSCTARSATNSRSAARPPWESILALLRALRRPPLGSSAGSRVSSGSSVWWAEVVDLVRGGSKEAKEEKKERESRRTSEGCRRTPLSDVFPLMGSRRSSAAESMAGGAPPMLTVEEATTDGHGHGDDEEEDFEIVTTTPVKRSRPRPISDDGKGRVAPRASTRTRRATVRTSLTNIFSVLISFSGVLNLLDAATNDLAQLITHLELDAMPGTPSPAAKGHLVPRKEWEESPRKSKMLRPSTGSVSSLRSRAAPRPIPPA